ncbi:hypothetical protein ACS0TY_021170 [Phlomoides rotata]
MAGKPKNDAVRLQESPEPRNDAVCSEILTQNAQTQYLKCFNLDGATDRETFKSKIPMITYDDIQPLIKRKADGDRSPILSAHPISEFLTSSGTSAGERKLMPTSIKEDMNHRQLLYSLLTPVMNTCLSKRRRFRVPVILGV